MKALTKNVSPGEREVMKQMRGLSLCPKNSQVRAADAQRQSLILDLFLRLQQALEHDVSCNDAVGDYQSFVSIRGRCVQIDIDNSLPLLDWECFEDGDGVRIALGVKNSIAFL